MKFNTKELAFFALVRADFVVFLKQAFYELYPGKELLWNWHIEAIIHQLEESLAGRRPRLIVNLPPRQLKSFIVSVCWPAFLLGQSPTLKLVVASYSEELAKSLSRDFNRLVTSIWYRAVFPEVTPIKSTELDFVTNQGGYRYAVSVGGSLTGKGADLIIIDDPIKPDDILTQRRDSVNDWYRGTLLSRLDDKARAGLIIVMQRLHQNDLTGFAELGGSFYKLSLPAIAVRQQSIELRNGRVHLREEGEPLQLERESLATLEAVRNDIGAATFAAQYQQEPASGEGAMFKRKWFQRINGIPTKYLAKGDIYISIDAAASTSETADYTAISVVLESHGKFFVLRAERGRWDYEELMERALHWYKFIKTKLPLPVTFLVEAASAGLSLYQSLDKIASRTRDFRCFYYRPQDGKEVRAATAVVAMSEGRVYVQDAPGINDWVDAYIAEFLAFPKGRFDDQVDSLSQLIKYRLRHIHANERPSVNWA